MAATLLLADDHQIVRQRLSALLKTEADFQLVGEAADGLEAVRLAERLQPDVLVLDLMMPTLNGLEVARQVRRRAARTRIVVLSMYAHETCVAEALKAGASAYVVKDAAAAVLVQAIRAAVAGHRFLSPPLTDPVGVAAGEAVASDPPF